MQAGESQRVAGPVWMRLGNPPAVAVVVSLLGTLALWHWSMGSVSIDSVRTRKAEFFY